MPVSGLSNSPYSGIGRPPPSRKPAQVAIRIIFFYWTTGPSTFLTPTKTHQGRRSTPSLTSVPLPRRIRFGYQRRNIYAFSTSLPHHRKTHEVSPGVNHLYSCLYYGKIVSNSPPHYLTRNPTEVELDAYTAHLVVFTTATSTRTSKRSINAFSTLPPYHQNTTKIDLGTSMTLSRCHYYGKTDSDIQGATYMRSLPYYLTIKTPQRLTWVHPQPTYLPNITHIQAGRDFHHVFFFSILTACIPFSCVLFFSYYLHHFFCGLGRSDFFHLGALLCVHSPTTVFLSYSPLLLCCVHHFLKGTLLPWSILQGEEFGRFWFGLGVFSFRPLFSLLLKKAFLFITFCSC